MSITLVPTDDGVCDLRFGIRDRDAVKAWKIGGLDYTQEKVRDCVPKHARSEVLALLLKAVEKLILETRFEKITMETHYQHLETKAIKKYDDICKILKDNGFSEDDSFRSEDGTNYWLFSKTVEGA